MSRRIQFLWSSILLGAIAWFVIATAHAQVPIYTRPAGLAGGGAITGPILAPDGSASAPSYSFSNDPTMGMFRLGSGLLALNAPTGGSFTFQLNGSTQAQISTGTVTINGTTAGINFNETLLQRDSSANILAQKNGVNAQTFRVYGTTTGPKYLSLSHDGSNAQIDTAPSSGALTLGAVNAASINFGGGSHATGLQFRVVQQTAPTCTSNCGTSPSVTGSDTAGIATMGATGSPASGWVVTFNGTWAAAPSCIVQSALSSMVVGKMPIAVQTSTTTMTVTTNGTAPGNSDKYSYICIGNS